MPGVYPTGDSLSPVTRFVRLTVPEDMWVISVIRSLLLQQTEPESWYPAIGVTQEQAAAAFTAIEESVIEDYQETAVIPIGCIVAFPTNAAPPSDWLKCDGSGYAEIDYPDLALLINGVSGVGGFDLPNLNGRVPVGINNLTVNIGSTGDLNTTPDLNSVGYYGMVWWIKAL